MFCFKLTKKKIQKFQNNINLKTSFENKSKNNNAKESKIKEDAILFLKNYIR